MSSQLDAIPQTLDHNWRIEARRAIPVRPDQPNRLPSDINPHELISPSLCTRMLIAKRACRVMAYMTRHHIQVRIISRREIPSPVFVERVYNILNRSEDPSVCETVKSMCHNIMLRLRQTPKNIKTHLPQVRREIDHTSTPRRPRLDLHRGPVDEREAVAGFFKDSIVTGEAEITWCHGG